jgi:CelD/BcsL family acetyltransferase involved in cellulose biosynthesis
VELTSAQTLTIQLVTSFEGLLSLEAEWLAFELRVGAELPFQTWEWAVAWWQHLREDNHGVRDRLRVCVVRDPDQDVVAIAPLILTERPSFGPVRVRQIQFIGADPNITEIRGMLCRPELEQECCRLLRSHFADNAEDWDWITWEGLCPPDADVSGHDHDLLPGVEKSAFVLSLESDWETMKARLSRNIKESLRKCYNSLRRDGLESSLEVVEEPDAVERGLGDFYRLHAERAARTDTVHHANVFGSDEARAFLSDVCRRLADRGVAKLFRLRIDGQVVALRVGFQMGQMLYLYYSGWEPSYGRYSVMTTLLAEIVKFAIERGLTSVNLSTGNDVSKTRWRPREVVYRSAVEVAPRVRARAHYLGFRAVRSVGAGRVVREMLPSFLVRRSEPRTKMPSLSDLGIMRLHHMAAAAAVVATLDLLDHRLDHQVLLLHRSMEHFLN